MPLLVATFLPNTASEHTARWTSQWSRRNLVFSRKTIHITWHILITHNHRIRMFPWEWRSRCHLKYFDNLMDVFLCVEKTNHKQIICPSKVFYMHLKTCLKGIFNPQMYRLHWSSYLTLQEKRHNQIPQNLLISDIPYVKLHWRNYWKVSNAYLDKKKSSSWFETENVKSHLFINSLSVWCYLWKYVCICLKMKLSLLEI